ncbi:MAG: BspA family leucine-rich repeat surface protein, partial [Saprospiraceae bacterium]|nr:BspA family leucine-rich repeat surface protein [Saprospiraceae bacterium]
MKTLYLLAQSFFFFSLSLPAFSQPFITTWKTDNPGTSNSTSITIPTFPGESYSYDVDWDNDGVFDEFGITGDVTHDFGVAGTYTIRIQGTFPRIYFNFGGDKQKITDISQWGSIAWSSMQNAFTGCTNMTYSALDAPDLSIVTNMSGMLEFASSFDGDLSNWDVSNVTNMDHLFGGAASFNGNISNWDVSNVTNMSSMFANASSFNGDISNWDVSNVTSMSAMFAEATAFNGDLSAWDVGNVTHIDFMFSLACAFSSDLSAWNVSKVEYMGYTFFCAANFNSDLSSWDVSKVEGMDFMFSGATSFNSDLSTWDVSNVTNMLFMFNSTSSFDQDLGSWNLNPSVNIMYLLDNSGLSIANYDNTLIGWESQGISGLSLGAAGLEYCTGEPARTSLINNYGWFISGDALNCPAIPSFISTWKTDNPGTSSPTEITIPT